MLGKAGAKGKPVLAPSPAFGGASACRAAAGGESRYPRAESPSADFNAKTPRHEDAKNRNHEIILLRVCAMQDRDEGTRINPDFQMENLTRRGTENKVWKNRLFAFAYDRNIAKTLQIPAFTKGKRS
jgi:hypothetical protein